MVTSKQLAIREAYSPFLHELQDEIDFETGICSGVLRPWHFPIEKVESMEKKDPRHGGKWRPISLQGIETNNDWITLEPNGSNFPTDNNVFYWYAEGGRYYNTCPCNLMSLLSTYNFLKGSVKPVTHFKPVTKTLNPLW